MPRTAYVQKYGKPKTVEELDQHRMIIFGEDARAPVQDVNWLLREGNADQNRAPGRCCGSTTPTASSAPSNPAWG